MTNDQRPSVLLLWVLLLFVIGILQIVLIVYLVIQRFWIAAIAAFALGTVVNFGLSMAIATKYRDVITSSRDNKPPGS
ncbi:MAG: hypothetical protein JJU33_01370 [Phycisphaerales bacterium]|nr:hypothetical protein [Phycisphaerales bacterium]